MSDAPSRLSRAALLRIAALAIFCLGATISVRIDQKARSDQAAQASQPDDMLATSALSPADSKRYGYQMGQVSGGIGLLFDRATQALAGLAHGRPLALLIAAGAFAAAGALLIAADRAQP